MIIIFGINELLTSKTRYFDFFVLQNSANLTIGIIQYGPEVTVPFNF